MNANFEIGRIMYPESQKDVLYIINWGPYRYEQLSMEAHAWDEFSMESSISANIVAKIVNIKIK